MIWWLIAAMLLGAVSYGLIQPWWAAWQSLPRENQEERRRRRCRVALRRADELLADHPRMALYAARRAHRIDPNDPYTLWALGQALAACRHYEAAVKHFEEAYHAMTRAADEGIAHLAVAAARCCACLRNDAPTQQEAETRAEQVLSWTRVAARDDPVAADILADDPLLRDLCGQVRLLHTWEAIP